MNSLDAIFAPTSTAVIGASATPGKVGHDIFANILKGGYSGTLYPVNPRAKSILSVHTYANLSEIPDPVDLGIIILPPTLALTAVEDAIKSDVKGIVIVSAGFREVGGEGLQIENRIVDMCREAGVRLVGPNCLGVINPSPTVGLNASFSARMPEHGNISFISQSGALCTAVLDFAADRDFGFSKFISIGNKADVDELDLLKYFDEDLETKVIMIYLEELRRGPEFIETVKQITSGHRPTPIVAIKSGRTAAGAAAAASHTGSIAGSEAVYDAIFEQCGIIRVETINELFDYANAFTYKSESALGKLVRKVPNGNRVAIVTNAGGPGILATDMTASTGLQLAKFKPETIDKLAQHLPETANLHNPVDVIGDASKERYEKALETVIGDDGVDGALVLLTPQSMTNVLGTAEAIVKIAQRSHKPIICSFMGIFDVSSGVKYLQAHGYPVYKFPENAAKAFAALYNYANWLNREQVPTPHLKHDKAAVEQIIEDCLGRNQTYLGELEGLQILKLYGFNVLPTHLATSAAEAVTIAEEMQFPVVMKIVSPQIIHKSDAGGVKVGLENTQEVEAAYETIVANAQKFDPEATIHGVLVQKMASSGEEVILGMNRYPVFGPLLMFGLGGIFVEIFKDVSFRLAPIGKAEAMRMVTEIKGHKLLTGYRGRPEVDIERIEDDLVRLSMLASNHPQIGELDINPMLAHPDGEGATVADCRIILRTETET